MNTINFMYFAHNYNTLQLDLIFKELGNYNHFKSKFIGAKGTSETEKFFNWFMMLSIDNMLLVVQWVELHYKNL